MVESSSPASTAGAQPGGVRMGVVIPLADEADTVDELLSRVAAQLTPADRVFCVVDESSTDNTRQLVEACAGRDARVTLIWAPENRCVVDAYFRGYRAAFDCGARWILEMDGGLSHLPEQIPRFIAAMEDGLDLAAGCRFIEGGSYHGRISRRLLSRGGSMLARRLLGTAMLDMTSGFECFSRRAMQHVLTQGVRSRAHFFQTEIRYMLRDWKWREIPITYANPSTRVGSASLIESLRILWQLHRQSRKQRSDQKRG